MAKKLKTDFVDHKKFLFESFALAHKAIKLDQKGVDNEKARFLYQECSQRFNLISPFLPDEHAKVLNKYSRGYSDRAKLIHDEIRSSQAVQKKITLPEAYNFKKEKWEMRLEGDNFLRTFSVMMRIKKTILKEKGYYVLPDFFVPRDIWIQKDFTLSDLAEKENFFRKVTGFLQQLSASTNRIESMNEFLLKFQKELQVLKTASMKNKNLSSKPKVQKRKKGIFGKKKRKKDYPNEEYVQLLTKFFDSAQFFNMWAEKESKKEKNKKVFFTKMGEVSHELYFKVITGIVFKDMFDLIENYFRLCRRQFARLTDQ